jgi:hypothetical protein
MPTKSGELTKKEMVKELAEIFGETQSLWNACPANKLRAIYVEVKTGHTAGGISDPNRYCSAVTRSSDTSWWVNP